MAFFSTAVDLEGERGSKVDGLEVSQGLLKTVALAKKAFNGVTREGVYGRNTHKGSQSTQTRGWPVKRQTCKVVAL